MVALGIALLLNNRADPRAGGLPDDLLPAGRDPGRSRPRCCSSSCSTRRPASSTRSSGSSGIDGPRWFFDPDWAKTRIDPAPDLGRRRRRDHLSRRAPGRVASPVRGRGGRRRRSMGQAAPRDDPDDQPGHPVQPDRRRDRGLPAVHRRPSSSATASRGRPTTRRSAASRTPCSCYGLESLQHGVPLLPDGLRVRPRLGPAGHHPARDRRDAPRASRSRVYYESRNEGDRDALAVDAPVDAPTRTPALHPPRSHRRARRPRGAVPRCPSCGWSRRRSRRPPQSIAVAARRIPNPIGLEQLPGRLWRR